MNQSVERKKFSLQVDQRNDDSYSKGESPDKNFHDEFMSDSHTPLMFIG